MSDQQIIVRAHKWRLNPDGTEFISNPTLYRWIKLGVVDAIRTGGATFTTSKIEAAYRLQMMFPARGQRGRALIASKLRPMKPAAVVIGNAPKLGDASKSVDISPGVFEVRHVGKGMFAVFRGDERFTSQPLPREAALEIAAGLTKHPV